MEKKQQFFPKKGKLIFFPNGSYKYIPSREYISMKKSLTVPINKRRRVLPKEWEIELGAIDWLLGVTKLAEESNKKFTHIKNWEAIFV
jgi:hypothetical protein